MSEKKTTSKPASKKVALARRVAPKAVPTPRPTKARDEVPSEEARGVALLAAAKAARAYAGPTGAAAIMECAGTINDDEAAVFEEALRWVRGDDEPEEPCTSLTPAR